MKGLILKDWYMLLKTMKTMLIFLFIYGIIGSTSDSMRSFFCVFSVVMGSLMVRSLMAYEEQSKWELLAVHLPVTTKQLVLEKYIVGGSCMLFTGVLITLLQLVTHNYGTADGTCGSIYVFIDAGGRAADAGDGTSCDI